MQTLSNKMSSRVIYQILFTIVKRVNSSSFSRLRPPPLPLSPLLVDLLEYCVDFSPISGTGEALSIRLSRYALRSRLYCWIA